VNNQIAIKDLALFAEVARASGFAEVARVQGMSPAFVSKRIAELERVLRIRLFHRSTRSVSLTREGEAALQRARRILDEVAQLSDAAASARETPRGLLRISSSAGFGRTHLASALSELVRRHPLLDLQLELLDRTVDLIGEGFDLDVRVGGTREGSLFAQLLARNQRVLCAAPSYLAAHGHPRCPEDLVDHRCIVTRERDHSFGVWRLSGPRGARMVKVTPCLSCNNGEVVRHWGLEGHGVILRSTWDVGEDLGAGRLIRVLPDYFQEADIAAIYPYRLEGSSRLRVCVEFLKDWFAVRAPNGFL
jgi:LysR family transcriptional activator of dmlA